MTELFSSFEETATAAASLAQVHRAVLRETGQPVAVKVQYPGLASSVASDLTVLRAFNVLAALLFPDYRLAWLVDELAHKLGVELDFRIEITNSKRVASLLKDKDCVAVPTMYEPLCSPRLLVMEWVDGVKVNDKEAMKARGINPRAVGRQLVHLFGELTLIHGFMHGDPHAGNLMVRATGRGSIWSWLRRGSRTPYEVVLLDHGTYLEVAPELRQLLCQLWCSFVLQDSVLQAELSTTVAGKRGAQVLPVLLTQTARSRAEERAVKKAAGIAGVGDMAALLQSAPRPVIEVLRINTVIRAVSVQLGVSMEERRRILAVYARRGLPRLGAAGKHVHRRFNQWLCRLQLWTLMGLWQTGAGIQTVLVRSWSLVLGLWADVLLD